MELSETLTNEGESLQQADGADAWVEEKHYRVVLNLANGDWVEHSSFPDEESAEVCARDLAARLASTSEWPRIRGRYLRPETIVSIEISERRRMTGSHVRERYWQGVDE
jgi:hypothetical protein